MPHHFPKNTIQAEAYCSVCGKPTPHYVGDGRLGRCMNDHPHPIKPPKPVSTQKDLFK